MCWYIENLKYDASIHLKKLKTTLLLVKMNERLTWARKKITKIFATTKRLTNLDLDQEEQEEKEEPRSADFFKIKIKAADVIRLRHCQHIHRNIIN